MDPNAPIPTTPTARVATKLAELDRRLRNLERANPTTPQVESVTGLPLGPTGSAMLERTTRRLYYVVDGALHYVALT